MAREEVLDHSAVMTPERGYSAPMPVLLEPELGSRGYFDNSYQHPSRISTAMAAQVRRAALEE